METYTARQLSEAFEIPIAKWKRWAREFIGIDPLAGRFGGVSREFDREQTFHVYLGGILVSLFLFSIPEAKIIIQMIKPFLEKWGLWPGTEKSQNPDKRSYVLFFQPDVFPDGRICQGAPRIRYREVFHLGISSEDGFFTERYKESVINKGSLTDDAAEYGTPWLGTKHLPITSVFNQFNKLLSAL